MTKFTDKILKNVRISAGLSISTKYPMMDIKVFKQIILPAGLNQKETTGGVLVLGQPSRISQSVTLKANLIKSFKAVSKSKETGSYHYGDYYRMFYADLLNQIFVKITIAEYSPRAAAI